MILDEDQVLIKKTLRGERSAYEELMRKYEKKIFSFVIRMVRNEEVAVDLTQDFFFKIYTVMDKYNFEYKFSTWAYRICYNLVIDHIRKNQSQVDSLDDDSISPHELFASENVSREDGFKNLAREETRDYVWRVVDHIPLKFRELILLRYIQDLKYEEIAVITSLPVGTVKNRIFKAKELLKQEMEKDGMLVC
ncbi:MAG: sigma-70 family RNA polymerase sigma factor [Chrysiogenales bacterium]|nr:sigma-70 family RNA polymerase sigma factor [Candidatus Aminicenantes bacterium]TFG73809.1 MAG: sigma-70 family RNA polymerase sigma factor [Chrysiogenales bacterium]